ncbi:MAG: aminoglycoside phosphotransferase family protein [Myxococcales bacterium]|nr:aminoglycoside phosphotransferase family protein [Myxococcales bacterium]MCB9703277.1 aminoglycoside phosphotransferase family protein [Myxococcales bacterium]
MANLPPASEGAIAAALAAFPELDHPEARPLAGGLINQTFAVEAGGERYILQRLSPIFAPAIHWNIAAVSERLRARGERSPRLLESAQGRPWVDLGEAGIWRVMTRIPGVTFDTLVGDRAAQARSAGALVARFHGALRDLDHAFQALRQGVHDTPAHLARLRQALAEGAGHRLFGEVEALAGRIFAAVEGLPPAGEVPSWVVHGDLKISNILFDEADPREARCLIDLDTVGRMPLWMELGDAWRSWCNPGGEDQSEARFDLEVFAASVEGYLGDLGAPLSDAERRSLVHGVEWIAVELSARFAADAIFESYFGWDRARFPAAGEHNLLRARGQFALFEAALTTRGERAALLLGGR